MAVFFVLFPMNSAPSLLCLIAKCFPIAALCLFVLMHGMSFKFEYSYSRRIFTGLLFSMLGDACLVYKEELVYLNWNYTFKEKKALKLTRLAILSSEWFHLPLRTSSILVLSESNRSTFVSLSPWWLLSCQYRPFFCRLSATFCSK